MIYIATIGTRFKIEPFEGSVPLKKDHDEVLNGSVYYHSPMKVKIDTTLVYDIGQEVSIGGFPIGGKGFDLKEVSITDNPVLPNAKIIERRNK